jgi:hypothetical protein
MSPSGPSRHFAVMQQFSRFRSEADIQRAALTEPGFMSTPPSRCTFERNYNEGNQIQGVESDL